MAADTDNAVELDISIEKVCYIILKAREYDAKVPPVEADPGSNPTDDGERAILDDYRGDATQQELRDAIDGLNEDEAIDLIAIAWVARGVFLADEWDDAHRLAQERPRSRSARYLLGIPNLSDVLEAGFTVLGFSCADVENAHE